MERQSQQKPLLNGFVCTILFLATQFSACTLSIRGKPDTLNSSQTSVSLNYTAQTSVQLSTPYFISGSPLNDTTAWLFPVHLGEGRFVVFRDFFNPASMTWTKDLNSPFFDNFASTNILLSDGRVFMFGQNGYTIYSPSTQSWTDPQDLLINREYTDAQLLPNNKVFIIGGKNRNYVSTDTTEIFDPVTNSIVSGPMLPLIGESVSTARLNNGKVLIVGRAPGNNAYQGLSIVYDHVTNAYTSVGTMNVPRGYFKMINLDNGKVLAAAGDDNSNQGITETAEIFDPGTGQWTLTGSLQRGRTYGALGKLRDGRVLIAAGYDQADFSTKLNSVEIYDPGTGVWSTSPATLAIPRVDFPLFMELPNGDVMIGGGFATGGFTKTVEIGKNFTTQITLGASGGDGNYTYTLLSGPGKIVGDQYYVGAPGTAQIRITDGGTGVGTASVTILPP